MRCKVIIDFFNFFIKLDGLYNFFYFMRLGLLIWFLIKCIEILNYELKGLYLFIK